jgi:hypothetical protein
MAVRISVGPAKVATSVGPEMRLDIELPFKGFKASLKMILLSLPDADYSEWIDI